MRKGNMRVLGAYAAVAVSGALVNDLIFAEL